MEPEQEEEPPSFSPEPGDLVITPSGALARVVRISEKTEEALVEWRNGETANIRTKLLRPAGDATWA
jgi:preprotein translocase subunit YajC